MSIGRRLLVIYNPTAGRRARRKLDRFLAGLKAAGASATLAETTGPLHAQRLAAEADPARFDAVVAAGGDGTINEAMNGLVVSALPLAILPLGTANVLANELDLPASPEALAHVAATAPARMIVPGEIAQPGQAPWRFLLMAGIGFDAEVVARLDVRLKRRIGKGAYVVGSLRQLMRTPPVPFLVTLDDRVTWPASLIVTRAHFYGGRFVLALQAHLDVDQLHAVSFAQPSRLSTLRYLTATVTNCLSSQSDVEISPVAHVTLSGPPGAPVQVDGDIRARLPARIGLAATPVGIIA